MPTYLDTVLYMHKMYVFLFVLLCANALVVVSSCGDVTDNEAALIGQKLGHRPFDTCLTNNTLCTSGCITNAYTPCTGRFCPNNGLPSPIGPTGPDLGQCFQQCTGSLNLCASSIPQPTTPTFPNATSNLDAPACRESKNTCYQQCNDSYCSSSDPKNCYAAGLAKCVQPCQELSTACYKQIPYPNSVLFFGDSATAGYGFYSDNNPMYSIGSGGFFGWVSGVNKPAWDKFKGCVPNWNNNNCSNNNGDAFGTTANIAYSFQFKELLKSKLPGGNLGAISLANYAVSGSYPAQWDSKRIEGDLSATLPNQEGSLTALAPVLQTNILSANVKEGSLVVLTLGANPMLARWLALKAPDTMSLFFSEDMKRVINGANVNDTCFKGYGPMLQCMSNDLNSFKFKEHFVNIYKALVTRHNVLVEKYHHSCPFEFGQGENGPAQNYDGVIEIPDNGGASPASGPKCSDTKRYQSNVLVDAVNATIDQAVLDVQKWAIAQNPPIRNLIASTCPGNYEAPDGTCSLFDGHAYGDPDPWVIDLDTGVHPNQKGHHVFALGVARAACSKLGLFCDLFEDLPLDVAPGAAVNLANVDPVFRKGTTELPIGNLPGGSWSATCSKKFAKRFETADGKQWMKVACRGSIDAVRKTSWVELTNCDDFANSGGILIRGKNCPKLP
jgi:hypothetical protein